MAARALERRLNLPRRSYKYARKAGGRQTFRTKRCVVAAGVLVSVCFLITLIHTSVGLYEFQAQSQLDSLSAGNDPLPVANSLDDREPVIALAIETGLRRDTQPPARTTDAPEQRKQEPLSKQNAFNIDAIPLEVEDVKVATVQLTQSTAKLSTVSTHTDISTPERTTTAATQQISRSTTAESKTLSETEQHRSECKIPRLNPFDPEVLNFYSSLPSTTLCQGQGVVQLKDNALYIVEEERSSLTSARCSGISRIQGNVTQFRLESPSALYPGIPNKCHAEKDFLQVDILSKGKPHKEYFLRVGQKVVPSRQADVQLGSVQAVNGQPLNVIVLFIASATHAHFQRKLKRVYSHLQNDVNTVIFHKYISSGEGLFPSLKTLVFGEASVKEDSDLFKKFKSHGYATLYSEDSAATSSLFPEKAWSSVDHFAQPFWHAVNKHAGESCAYNQPKFLLQLNYIKSLLEAYRVSPVFAVSVLSQFKDDKNSLSELEDTLLDFLFNFEGKGYSMDTVLILAGDTVDESSDLPPLSQLRIEERLPFLSITYPRFTSSHDLSDILSSRISHLITPADLHLTLTHLLTYPKLPQHSPAISLFANNDHSSRDCDGAGIDARQCPCYRVTTENPNSGLVGLLTRAVIGHLNQVLDSFVDLLACSRVSLRAVLRAEKLVVEHALLVAGDRAFPELYEIRLSVSPGAGTYSAKVRLIEGRIRLRWLTRLLGNGEEKDCYVIDNKEKANLCLCQKQVT